MQSGGFKSAYFIFGKDAFLKKSAIELITNSSVTAVRELNFEIIQSQSITMEDILVKAETMPFMSERRVICIQNFPFKSKSNELIEYLGNPNSNSVIIFVGDEIPAFLKGCGNITQIDCNGLSHDLTKKWVSSRFLKNGVSVTNEAVELLINYSLSDFYKMESEINKLSCLVEETKKVEKRQIIEVVSPNFDYQIYELINSVCAKLKTDAFQMLNSILQSVNYQVVLIALYNHFRVMFFAKVNSMSADELAERFKMFKFKANLVLKQKNKFSEKDILNVLKKIGEIDYKIKTGKIDGQTAVECIMSLLVA